MPRAQAVQRLFAGDPVGDARLQLVRPLVRMIWQFFPMGSGFGSFDPVYRGFEPFANLALTYMNQAHDDYLQIVLEGGLAGLALMIVFIGWWAWMSIRLWHPQSGKLIIYGRLGSAVLLLLMAASLADYPVRTPLIMVLAAQSAMWMLVALSRRETSRPASPLYAPRTSTYEGALIGSGD